MRETDSTNILIVDDRPEKLLVYQTILEELGQTLVTVSSGAEALRQVLKQDFAVILLDVYMPQMDGFETARFIRQRKRSAHTPIIFLTAFTDEVRTAEGYASGAVDYILTPVVPEILRAKVRIFVELFLLRQQMAHQAEARAHAAAAEATARRSAFLAEASRTLTTSLDLDVTRHGLLRLVVPEHADLAAVTLAERLELPWKGEAASATPSGEVALRPFALADLPDGSLRQAHDQARTTGTTVSLTDLSVSNPEGSPEPFRTAVVVPLVARGITFGLLTLAHTTSRTFDLPLLEDLAGRAAIALDNARLYRDIQENDERKNEFLAMLAHELRNPLAPIRNALELLRRSDAPQAQVSWARELIDRQFRHLARLVDDLLDVSRITRGKINLRKEMVEVSSIVSAALETSRPLIEERGHELTVSVPPVPLRILADPARMTQALTNLLNNAAKYTPRGGQIGLGVDRDGDDVVFTVRDNGSGIPPEMLCRIFDLFTQVDRSIDRSQGGLGIGLTLVRRLVELHGGTVSAHSTGPGEGSEFIVRLPLPSSEPVPPPRRTETPLPPTKVMSLRILVVDDNADGANTLGLLLRLAGHEVRLAYDGPTAVTTALDFEPHVVLLDIGLPGLDGYQVARQLRMDSRTSDTLLIAVSGYGQEADRIRSREAGFANHLVKPVDFATLRALLAGYR
jgi:signal transduction histidine kinase/DNA-binding response OmpR family regulator